MIANFDEHIDRSAPSVSRWDGQSTGLQQLAAALAEPVTWFPQSSI